MLIVVLPEKNGGVGVLFLKFDLGLLIGKDNSGFVSIDWGRVSKSFSLAGSIRWWWWWEQITTFGCNGEVDSMFQEVREKDKAGCMYVFMRERERGGSHIFLLIKL